MLRMGMKHSLQFQVTGLMALPLSKSQGVQDIKAIIILPGGSSVSFSGHERTNTRIDNCMLQGDRKSTLTPNCAVTALCGHYQQIWLFEST